MDSVFRCENVIRSLFSVGLGHIQKAPIVGALFYVASILIAFIFKVRNQGLTYTEIDISLET
ncbi:hypothetical protein SDC9_67390 [bioreactor metagenome]|uniref:Uncharacterized protein n=1 Tax=bioreactor metagenome TaxID=1076179 RepID=A0A644XZ70_9ZZZZ